MEFESPGILFSFIAFLVLLTPLVFVHEFGHFWVARRCGVKVDVFSIGFGKTLWSRVDKKGTEWRISLIPLGGYVKFAGDMDAASAKADIENMSEDERSGAFVTKPLWQRASIVAAGPLINFLFAIVVFAGFYTAYGKAVPVTDTEIAALAEGGAAEAAGLQVGDIIREIDGDAVSTFQDIQTILQISTGDALVVRFERVGVMDEVVVTPMRNEETDQFGNSYVSYRLGISSGRLERVQLNPIQAVGEASRETWRLTNMMLSFVGQVITGDRSTEELGGPVRIAQYTGQSASLGWASFITFMALISINLGLVNLFPIPVLDGGHLMFYGIEAIMGKPLSVRAQELALMGGMALMACLFVFLIWNDMTHILG